MCGHATQTSVVRRLNLTKNTYSYYSYSKKVIFVLCDSNLAHFTPNSHYYMLLLLILNDDS